MADLTDAQEKDYTRQIIGILKQYSTDMQAKDVDPTSRITNLENGADSTDQAEAAVVKADEAAKNALDLANKLRTDNYALAQASVGLIEGALGKDSAAAITARGIRASMSNMAARGHHTPPAQAPAK